MTTTEEPITRDRAEMLINEMLRGRDLHSIFTDMMNETVKISGETIPFWEKKFKLKIQFDNLTPETCRNLGLQIIQLNQEATFLYNMSLSRAQMIKHSSESIHLQKFEKLVDEYKQGGKRLPAEKTLDNLARVNQLDIESAQKICDIEVKFWKNILSHLDHALSAVKSAGMLLSAEMKALSADRVLDNMEKGMNKHG